MRFGLERRIFRDVDKGGSGWGGPRKIFADKMQEAIEIALQRSSQGKRRQIPVEEVMLDIFEQTGDVISFPALLARAKKMPGVAVDVSHMKNSNKKEDILFRIKILYLFKHLSFSKKTPRRFSDGWTFAYESFFREHRRFPNRGEKGYPPNSFVDLLGIKRAKNQLLDHYWKMLPPKPKSE